MLWMPQILFVIFGMVAFIPEWRRTCLIICIASLANVIYQPILEIAATNDDQWVLAVHAIADAITIFALLIWGSRGKFLQASVLTLFISTNLVLAADYLAPPYPFYESYMGVIFTLNIIQILLISGGIYAVAGNSIKFFKFILARITWPILGGIRRSYYGGGSAGSRTVRHRSSRL